MRLLVLPLFVSILAGWLLAAEPTESKSALESDPSGWTDLLPGKGLQGWKRVPIPPPPKGKLSERNPWSVDDKSKLLICDAEKIHEMLLYDKELADGIFHVEWRFKKIEGKKGYNSGVYVRNSADGAIWHQVQVGNLNVGYIFGKTLVDGAPKGVNIKAKGGAVRQGGRRVEHFRGHLQGQEHHAMGQRSGHL